MHRPIVALFTCLLLTATGLGLLGVAATVTPAPVVFVVTATVEPSGPPTPRVEPTPEPELVAADVLILSPGGLVALRVSRLVLAPGTVLPPEQGSAPTALIAEQGAVGVLTYGIGLVGRQDADTVLRPGEHLVIASSTVRTVRNTGPTPAVILVVAIEPVATPCLPPEWAAADLAPCGAGG